MNAGARWADVIKAAAVHGLAPLSGSSADVGGARSDVTMLLRLDPKRGATILSIPRDLFLPMLGEAVQAGVATVMPAFLDLNGTPATANRKQPT